MAEYDYPPDGTFCLYMDESGEFGQKAGSSQYFLVTLICTQYPKALRKKVWKKKAQLYGLGWPKDVEIKGTSLWGSPHYKNIPDEISDRRIEHILDMLTAILSGPISVHYSIVRKAGLSAHLFQAEDGILFNWIAGTLLSRACPHHFNGPLRLIVDQRSKETHHKLKFDGYVETKLIGEAGLDAPLEIDHRESHVEFGLQAVDLISWSLFRYFEHNDDQFTHVIAPSVGFADQWYVGKRCPGK